MANSTFAERAKKAKPAATEAPAEDATEDAPKPKRAARKKAGS